MTRLVLVHGFSQTHISWHQVLPHLSGHEVTTVDLPFHGSRSDDRGDLWQCAQMLHDDAGTAVYVGYSMGARVVLHLALSRPEAVPAMVLLGGSAGVADRGERRSRRLSDDVLARTIERRGVAAFLEDWQSRPMFASLPDDPVDLQARLENPATSLAAALRLAGTGTQDPPLWGRLDELRCPSLILAGERDDKFCALGRQLAGGIGAPATFVTLPGVGHAAHMENPEMFANVVNKWLTGLDVLISEAPAQPQHRIPDA